MRWKSVNEILQEIDFEKPKREQFRYNSINKYKEKRIQDKIQSFLNLNKKSYKTITLLEFMARMDKTKQYNS
jgi:hypothetical protein